MEHAEAQGRDVLVVHVPDGQDKPYRANSRVYVRIDREVHEATREEIGQLMFESGRVQYERLPVPDAKFVELDDALVRGYFEDVRHLLHPADAAERMRLLVNLGFAIPHASHVVPTVAGLLLFGPRPQDRLPAATLKCAFFYGRHLGAQLRDRADVVGPLTRVIDEGAAFVARNRRLVPRMEGVRRVDVPEYPDYSVREAIANAVAHRDWSLEGAKVRLFMFDDRLEIWSPGKLPPPITLERLGYDQFSRNKVIARLLVELGYIEEVGLGIRRMREEMASLGLPEPEFREDGFSFVITLRSIATREGVTVPADLFRALVERGEINERQHKGLLHAQKHGTIARREYVALTGVSERTAANDLADLVRRELLEPTGGWVGGLHTDCATSPTENRAGIVHWAARYLHDFGRQAADHHWSGATVTAGNSSGMNEMIELRSTEEGDMATQEASDKKPAGMQAGKRYKCAQCASEVLVTKPGQGTLCCCGEAMQQK
ncbi:MAG: hypothetical protein EPO21_03705 [Chloroflexota bacterium]|nr:MAG: hypothetical protein EPO21_03705 [Chloroflexota bacterium]